MTGKQLGVWGYSIAVTSRASGQPLSSKILAVSIDLSSGLHWSLPKGLTIVSPALFQFCLLSICLPRASPDSQHLMAFPVYLYLLLLQVVASTNCPLAEPWILNSLQLSWFTESWATLKAADHRFLGQVVRGSPIPEAAKKTGSPANKSLGTLEGGKVTTLYTLNSHRAVCQWHLNQTRDK